MLQLSLVAASLEGNIYIYNGKNIIRLAGKSIRPYLSTLNKIKNKVNHYSKRYTLVKFNRGYFLKIPVTPDQILFFFPNFNINNMRIRSQYLLTYLTRIHDICKLVYSAFSNKEAPDWPIVVNYFYVTGKMHSQEVKDPTKNFQSFYEEQNYLMKAIMNLDEVKVRRSLEKVNHWNFMGTMFAKNNYIRGEKDVLISMLTDLSRAVIEAGLPVKYSFSLLDELIQKVELQNNIPLFNLYMQELIWRYFRELKYFRLDHQLPIAERCMRYIRNNITEMVTVNEICNHFHCSKTILCRTFKEKYHKSINIAMREIKISAAKDLLVKTRYSIKEIYTQLGFTNASYFYRVFKPLVGMTPKQYRLKYLITK